MTLRSEIGNAGAHAIVTEVLAKNHANTTDIRITGEPVFGVIGQNKLNMPDKLLMQLRSGGFMGLHRAIVGRMGH
jgi:hypothetical protein